MAMIMQPDGILALWGTLRMVIIVNYFLASRPSISGFTASWILCEVYKGPDFKSTSVNIVGYTYEAASLAFMISISCFRSGLFA